MAKFLLEILHYYETRKIDELISMSASFWGSFVAIYIMLYSTPLILFPYSIFIQVVLLSVVFSLATSLMSAIIYAWNPKRFPLCTRKNTIDAGSRIK